MDQSLGYVAQGENMVYKLRKAIYGLKQSPRVWFDKFSQIIMQVGFHRCVGDHSVFIKKSGGGIAILAVYVDNIFLTGSGTIGFAETKEYLRSYFATKDRTN